jgi:adenosylcobinamide-GDP ribazoletransferase
VSGIRTFVRSLRAAAVFLTRIPVGGFPYSREEWSWASGHFPAIGGMVGALTAAFVVAMRPAGAFPASVLGFGIALLLTGAFHEDGLADTSDALGGAFDRDKLRLILKDSRVGTFGASALVVSLVGRASLVATFAARPVVEVVVCLAFVSCVARVGPVWQMVVLPYATEQGAKSRDVTRARWPQALVATAWGALSFAFALRFGNASVMRLVAVCVSMVLVVLVTAYRYVVRLGGVAGDFLGATEQLCELAGFLALAYGRSL